MTLIGNKKEEKAARRMIEILEGNGFMCTELHAHLLGEVEYLIEEPEFVPFVTDEEVLPYVGRWVRDEDSGELGVVKKVVGGKVVVSYPEETATYWFGEAFEFLTYYPDSSPFGKIGT